MKRSKALLVSLLLALGAMMGATACGDGKEESSSTPDTSSSVVGSSVEDSSQENASSVEDSSQETSSEEESSVDTSEDSSVLSVTVSLDETALNMGLFDITARLTATVTGSEESVVWTTSNEEVVTVNGGALTPVSVGSATITATVEGVSATCQVTVEPYTGAIILTNGAEDFRVELGDSSQSLSPMGIAGTTVLTNGAYTYAVDNPQVATVNEAGVITPVGLGATNIRVNATFKGVAANELVIPILVVNPTVRETLSITAQAVKNRNISATIDLSGEGANLTSIENITIKDRTLQSTEYTFDADTQTITVDVSLFNGWNQTYGEYSYDVTIFADSANGYFEYTGAKVEYVDFAVGSVDELNAWGAWVAENSNTYEYVLITADIDYQGGVFDEYYSSGNFRGVFDGQGHAINNIHTLRGVFRGIAGSSADNLAIVRNVAFTNVLKDEKLCVYNGGVADRGGLLVNGLKNATIENVYVSGVVNVSGSNATLSGVIGESKVGSVVSNLVANVTMLGTTYPALIGKITAEPILANAYVVSNASVVYGESVEGLYADVAAFKAGVATLPSAFNATSWEINDDCGLVFKSATNYIENVSVFTLLAKDVMGADFADTTVTAKEDTLVFETSGTQYCNVFYTVDGADLTDIALDIPTATVTIGSFARDGAQFTVTATYYDSIVGVKVSEQKTFAVAQPYAPYEVAGTHQVVQNKSTDAIIDLSSYNLATIEEVTLNGVALMEEEDYTFVENSFELSFTALTDKNAELEKYSHELRVLGVGEGSQKMAIRAQIDNVDFLIETVDDWNAFGRNCQAPVKADSGSDFNVKSPYTYAILAADIDYQNGVWDNVWNNGAFYGVFEGQGHTISNLRVKFGVFASVIGKENNYSAVRNVAFTNVRAHHVVSGGLMAYQFTYATIENIFVAGAHTGNYHNLPYRAGFVRIVDKGATIDNCVVHFDSTNQQYSSFVASYYTDSAGAITDSYVITSTSKPWLCGTADITATLSASTYQCDPNSSGLYASITDFANAFTALPSTFDSEYWTYDEGYGIIFKGVAVKYVTQVTTEYVGADVTAGEEQTLTFSLTNGKAASRWELTTTDAENITIDAATGVVTVGANAAAGATFSVKAIANTENSFKQDVMKTIEVESGTYTLVEEVIE